MKKAELIFIPSPGVGHLVSAVEFSKRLLARDSRLSITILAMKSPFPTAVSTALSTVEGEGGPRYIFLPQPDPPPNQVFESSIEDYISKFAASHSHYVKDAITTLQKASRNPFHVVVDMFCTSFIDVADELGLPSYVFFTSGAAFLGLLLHLPDRYHRTGLPKFNESEPESSIPAFHRPLPNSALPIFAFNEAGYTAFMNHGNDFKKTRGVIVNTFAELEPFAIESVRETVPVYTVGPVLDINKPPQTTTTTDLKWLDDQPESSVVFLCFGSVGAFGEEQAREIAFGLIRSGQRFLWSLRKPTTKGAKRSTEYTETELKSVLPGEFWDAVEGGRGRVCGWAPQVEILGHKATGSFVSHCGWNSTLESVWFGKPMVAWPLYAEQRTNAFVLVHELGLAATWLGCGNKAGDVVMASEVERAIRCVMDMDNPVRRKVKEMSEISKSCLLDGGSSFNSIGCFVRNIIGDE